MEERRGTAPQAEAALARQDTLRALYDLAVATAGVREPAEVARVAVEHGCALLGAESGGIFTFEVSSGLLRPLVAAGPLALAGDLATGEDAIGLAFQTGRPLRVADYAAWRNAQPASLAAGLGSIVAVPLVAEGRTLGVLGAWSGKPQSFARADAEVLALLAAQVATILRTALLTDQARRKARMFEMLHEVAVPAAGLLQPRALAALVAARLCELMSFQAVQVWWAEPDSGRLDRLAPEPAREVESGAERLAQRAQRTGHAAWTRARGPVPAGLAIPLKAGQRLVGALTVWRPGSPRFEPEDIELLSLFAAQLAPALDSAHLAAESDWRARTFAALRELAVAAGGVLEPARLAGLVVDRAVALIEFDRVALYWWDHASGQLISLAASSPGGSRRLRPGQGAAGTAFKQAGPVLVEDYQEWPAATPWARRRGFHSVLAVPLIVNDQAVGAVSAYSLNRRAFSPDDVNLLSLLAAQVAPALEAARLHAGLAHSEERFRSLYQTLACGVLVLNAKGRVTDANGAAEEILGLRLNQMRGRPATSLWEAAAEAGGQALPQLVALETGRPVRDTVVRITRRDGGVRWVQFDSVPVLDTAGQPERVVSSLIDVSDRRRAEAALRQSEGRFRTVFDHAAVGIARIGLDGRILEANPALVAMLGLPSERLVGTKVSAIVLPEDQDRTGFASLVGGERSELLAEMRCRRGDGSLIWGRTTATLVRGDREEPDYVIAMVEDITDQKRQGEALAHQAMHDALTDLPNRTLLFDRLAQGIQLSQRGEAELALLVIDLDHFKEVNDSFNSHVVGDMLLRQVASRLRAQLRGSDTVARLGGDEFAAILMGVDGEAGAAQAAGKLLAAFATPFEVDGRALRIGASIGIALYPEHGEDADALLRRADSAMYMAKRSGSGLAVFRPD